MVISLQSRVAPVVVNVREKVRRYLNFDIRPQLPALTGRLWEGRGERATGPSSEILPPSEYT